MTMCTGQNVPDKLSPDKKSPETITVGLHFDGLMNMIFLKWKIDLYNA